MKTCDERNAMKMEAYLKFYAEYFSSKNIMKQNGSHPGKKLSLTSQPVMHTPTPKTK